MRARALLGVTRGIPGLIIRALLSARFLPLHCIITFVAEETSWKFHEVCRRDAARLSADQEEEAEEKGEEREREKREMQRSGYHGGTRTGPHTYTTRNENIPASFGLLSAIKRIPAAADEASNAPAPEQEAPPNLS